jgi:hypothetical protein
VSTCPEHALCMAPNPWATECRPGREFARGFIDVEKSIPIYSQIGVHMAQAHLLFGHGYRQCLLGIRANTIYRVDIDVVTASLRWGARNDRVSIACRRGF